MFVVVVSFLPTNIQGGNNNISQNTPFPTQNLGNIRYNEKSNELIEVSDDDNEDDENEEDSHEDEHSTSSHSHTDEDDHGMDDEDNDGFVDVDDLLESDEYTEDED